MTDLTDEHAAALAAATQRAEKAEADRATWTGNYIAAAARADRAEAALREATEALDKIKRGDFICSNRQLGMAAGGHAEEVLARIRALLADDAREEEGP